MRMQNVYRKNQLAFTLIEMVMVIVLMGIVGTMLSGIIRNQMNTYQDSDTRLQLISDAEQILELVSRDLRHALPNSIRTGSGGSFIEYIPIQQAARYRLVHSSLASSDLLDFSQADSSFQVLGHIDAPITGSRLVINNISQTAFDGLSVYGDVSSGLALPNGSHVITPSSVTISRTTNTEGDIINLSSGFQFSTPSMTQKFYLITTPETYYCDSVGGSLVKYKNYPITLYNQPISVIIAPLLTATNVLVSKNLASCSFTYSSALSAPKGLVSIELSLMKNGEKVRLTKQVQVVNTP